MVASVNEIAQEKIVVRFDIARLVWCAPKVKEAHEILVLAVDITENFDWSINFKNHGLGFDDLLSLVRQGEDVLSSESKVRLPIDRS